MTVVDDVAQALYEADGWDSLADAPFDRQAQFKSMAEAAIRQLNHSHSEGDPPREVILGMADALGMLHGKGSHHPHVTTVARGRIAAAYAVATTYMAPQFDQRLVDDLIEIVAGYTGDDGTDSMGVTIEVRELLADHGLYPDDVESPPTPQEVRHWEANAQSAAFALEQAAGRIAALQHAVDLAHSVLDSTAYVGGPSMDDAYRTAMRALGEVRTEHCASGEANDAG